MLAAGFALAARSWWIVAIMLPMFAAIYVPVIAGEERYLRQTFPGYDDYARRVPRLLPRLSPYGSQQSAYSSARYWKHREYEASIGCVVVLAVLVVKLCASWCGSLPWSMSRLPQGLKPVYSGSGCGAAEPAPLQITRSLRALLCSACFPDRGLRGRSKGPHGNDRTCSHADRASASQLSFSRWPELRLFGGVAFDYRRDRGGENGSRRERTQSQRVRRILGSRQRHLSRARSLRVALRSPDVLLALDLQAQRGRPHKRETSIRFDYAHKKSTLDEKNLKTGETKHVENDLAGCATDVITGFYYLQSLPLQLGEL